MKTAEAKPFVQAWWISQHCIVCMYYSRRVVNMICLFVRLFHLFEPISFEIETIIPSIVLYNCTPVLLILVISKMTVSNILCSTVVLRVIVRHLVSIDVCLSMAIVITVFKKGKDKQKAVRFRPVSSTSWSVNWWTALSTQDLRGTLETKRNIIPEQAFWQGRSTVGQITYISQAA